VVPHGFKPGNRVHRAVNVGKEVFEEVVTFFLDRPDARPQPAEGALSYPDPRPTEQPSAV